MSVRSATLLIITLLLVLLSVAVTFHNTVVLKNFPVIEHPSEEVPEESEEVTPLDDSSLPETVDDPGGMLL